MKILLAISISMFSGQPYMAKAQSASLDSIKSPRYKMLRVGAGYQRNFFGEVGFTWLISNPQNIVSITYAFYGAAEFNISSYAPVYGLKAGAETSGSLLGAGIELSYMSDFKNGGFFVMPKAGISLGTVNLFYGYRLPDNYTWPQSISPQQISLTANLKKGVFPLGKLLP